MNVIFDNERKIREYKIETNKFENFVTQDFEIPIDDLERAKFFVAGVNLYIFGADEKSREVYMFNTPLK